MKKINIYSGWRKSTFVLILSIGVLVAIVSSAFRSAQEKSNKSQLACNGPFYLTNVLGSGFSILSPGTGAPGQGTCNNCHTTYANNSGPGVLTLNIGGGITQYVPGQTYTVTVTISQSSITAFDFQLTNRPASGGTVAVGNFLITDASRTMLTNGNFGGSGSGINYVEGTACGVDVTSPGNNQWTFNWKAPTNAVGNITFYLGAIAANFNNQNTGDYTYSKTLQLSAVTGINDLDAMIDCNLYPNPASQFASVEIEFNRAVSFEISLTNILGEKLFLESVTESKSVQRTIPLIKFPDGIYFIGIKTEQGTINKKLIIKK